MTRGDQLRRLFASHARSDDVGFRKAANELVADERRKNHRLPAAELERALILPAATWRDPAHDLAPASQEPR
jgi:hypothetical protein